MAREFSWDTEKQMAVISEGDKQRKVITMCTLKGAEYIGIRTEKFFKDTWNITGGTALKVETFRAIYGAFEDWQMGAAFGTTDLVAATAPKKSTEGKAKKPAAAKSKTPKKTDK